MLHELNQVAIGPVWLVQTVYEAVRRPQGTRSMPKGRSRSTTTSQITCRLNRKEHMPS